MRTNGNMTVIWLADKVYCGAQCASHRAQRSAACSRSGTALRVPRRGIIPRIALTICTVAVTVNFCSASKCHAIVDEKCFWLETASYSSWHDAKDACTEHGEGFYLASTLSHEENEKVGTLLSKASCCAAWIGLSDEKNEGVMRWVDESPFEYDNFDPGGKEPNGGTDENCVNMWGPDSGRGESTWNDMGCDDKFPFVCSSNEKGDWTETEVPQCDHKPEVCNLMAGLLPIIILGSLVVVGLIVACVVTCICCYRQRMQQQQQIFAQTGVQMQGAQPSVQCQVPAGSGPGTQLQMTLPDGRAVNVTVPPGVTEGQTFLVQAPPIVVSASPQATVMGQPVSNTPNVTVGTPVAGTMQEPKA